MEDKTATRRHSRIPLRQRTTRWTVLFTRIQKRARRAQIIPHPQELSKLQRVGRREKPLLGRSSTTTRKHSSWASRPRRATSPPLPTRQVAAIQERQRTPEDENQYPEAHGRIYMIQEGRPSNRQQKQVTRQVFLATSAHPAVLEYLRGW